MIDLETTGLDPEKDQILEIGLAVYDDNLSLKDSWSFLIDPGMSQGFLEDKMPEAVLEMHTNNWLIENLYALPTYSLRAAEISLIEILKANGAIGLPLTGATISFDRAFLKKYMPHLEASFHYRSIDVSSLKILAKMQGLGEPPKADKTHRVMSCIAGTRDDLKWFVDNFMKGREGV